MNFTSLPLPLQVVVTLVGLVLLDVALGVLSSLVRGTFDLHKLPSFLETAIPTPQLVAFVVALVGAAVQPDGSLSSTALVAAVVTGGSALGLKLVADIALKLGALTAASSAK